MIRLFPLSGSTLMIILIWVFAISATARGDSADSNSEYIVTRKLFSVENGLASHEVFCGVQDASGFLWFGIRNGLNRLRWAELPAFLPAKK